MQFTLKQPAAAVGKALQQPARRAQSGGHRLRRLHHPRPCLLGGQMRQRERSRQQQTARLLPRQVRVGRRHLRRHPGNLGHCDAGPIHMLIIGVHPLVRVHAPPQRVPDFGHPRFILFQLQRLVVARFVHGALPMGEQSLNVLLVVALQDIAQAVNRVRLAKDGAGRQDGGRQPARRRQQFRLGRLCLAAIVVVIERVLLALRRIRPYA